MFFKKAKPEDNPSEDAQLRERLLLLIEEIENLRKITESKLRYLEENVETRIIELESKLETLEERLHILNQVLLGLDPSRRLN